MIVALANSKGGVGKSTTTIILADYLAIFHRLNVLIIDLDPQASASCLLLSPQGVQGARKSDKTLAHFLDGVRQGAQPDLSKFIHVGASDLKELRAIQMTARRGCIDLISSVPSLWFKEKDFVERFYRAGEEPARQVHEALSTGLADLRDSYNLILIDCPPNYSSLTQAGLMLSDVVVSPTTADEIAMMSLRDFTQYAIKDQFKETLAANHHVIVTRFNHTDYERRQMRILKQEYRTV